MTTDRRRTFSVALPSGSVPVSAAWTAGTNGVTVIVAHGAGAGMDHPFIVGFADELSARGFSTLRFNFPYIEQGRRVPGPAKQAIATWRAAVEFARSFDPSALVCGAGKSYGGRMASMAAAEGLPVDALAYLGYPLHPPGRPERLRAEHLPSIGVPQLFVSGSKDPFIQPLAQFQSVVAGCRDVRVAWVDGGGHSFEVRGNKRSASELGAVAAPFVAEFLTPRHNFDQP